MNSADSNLAMNAIAHAASMTQASFQMMAAAYLDPHVRYKPKLIRDGDKWCALLGDNVQEGVAGFGTSPREAMYDFDKEWVKPIMEAKP
jgi:hypothetical protein